MTIQFDPEAEIGNKVKNVSIQGEPLPPDCVYLIAHTDTETMQEYGYFQLEEGQQPKYEVPTIMREVIADHFHRYSSIPKPEHGRWQSLTRS
jgi:hypothetical protein